MNSGFVSTTEAGHWYKHAPATVSTASLSAPLALKVYLPSWASVTAEKMSLWTAPCLST